MIPQNDPANQGMITNAIEILTLVPANNAAYEVVAEMVNQRTAGNVIHLYKADPITDHLPVDDVTIVIKRQLPDINQTTLPKAESLYERDAEVLVSALKDSLPQGTRYRVALMLMAEIAKENLYRGI